MTREELDQYWKMYGYAMALANFGLPHDFQGDRREWCNVCGALFNETIHHQALPREGEVYSYSHEPGSKGVRRVTISHAGIKCCFDQVEIKQPLIRGPYYRKCTHNAKTVHAGKPYCDVHDPVAVERRREKAKNRWYARRGLRSTP